MEGALDLEAKSSGPVRCFGDEVMAITADQILEENGEEGGDPKVQLRWQAGRLRGP